MSRNNSVTNGARPSPPCLPGGGAAFSSPGARPTGTLPAADAPALQRRLYAARDCLRHLERLWPPAPPLRGDTPGVAADATQPDLALGDTVIALSAVPADATSRHYTGGEPHAPTAHFRLTHGAIHAAKGLGIQPHVGAIASSDTFYDPDPGRHLRWAERGVLAVEMEAAVLFTIGALRSVKTACILTVSDLVGSTQLVRIADDELALGVERMTRLALAAAVDAKA